MDDGHQLQRMRRRPTHPGDMFEQEWRIPSGISQAEAARKMKMSANRLNEIVKGKRSVTIETACWFEALTGIRAEVWLHAQVDYDLYRNVHWRALHQRYSVPG